MVLIMGKLFSKSLGAKPSPSPPHYTLYMFKKWSKIRKQKTKEGGSPKIPHFQKKCVKEGVPKSPPPSSPRDLTLF
jgi:hypothetical protein